MKKVSFKKAVLAVALTTWLSGLMGTSVAHADWTYETRTHDDYATLIGLFAGQASNEVLGRSSKEIFGKTLSASNAYGEALVDEMGNWTMAGAKFVVEKSTGKNIDSITSEAIKNKQEAIPITFTFPGE